MGRKLFVSHLVCAWGKPWLKPGGAPDSVWHSTRTELQVTEVVIFYHHCSCSLFFPAARFPKMLQQGDLVRSALVGLSLFGLGAATATVVFRRQGAADPSKVLRLST